MIEIYYVALGSILTVLAYFYASMLNTSFDVTNDYKDIDYKGFYELVVDKLKQENQKLKEELSSKTSSDNELCKLSSNLLNENQDLNVNMTTIQDILVQAFHDKKVVSKKLITECGFKI